MRRLVLRPRSSFWRAGLLSASALLVGCEVLGPIAMSVGSTLLQSVARKNFSDEYATAFERVLARIDARYGVDGPGTSPPPTEPYPTEPPPYEAPYEPTPGDSTAPTDPGDAVAGDPGLAGDPSFEGPVVADTAPLTLDVAVLREARVAGRLQPVPVRDGDVLRDGVGRTDAAGRPERGDDLKVRFRANAPCYVYAVWIDATAWATPIFPVGPAGEFPNPVEAGRDYTLPEGSDWYYLDGHRGIETLYFVASTTPLDDLDTSLRALVGATRPDVALDGSALSTVTEPAPVTRGVAGVRQGRTDDVVTSDGRAHSAPTDSFTAALASGELVVTRWFQHE